MMVWITNRVRVLLQPLIGLLSLLLIHTNGFGHHDQFARDSSNIASASMTDPWIKVNHTDAPSLSDFTDFTFDNVSLATPSFKKNAYSEFLHEGQHRSRVENMIPLNDGFCYLHRASAWHRQGETCLINAANGYWRLESRSMQEGFECGAACVLAEYEASGMYVSKGHQDHSERQVGWVKDGTHDDIDSICFFVWGQTWREHEGSALNFVHQQRWIWYVWSQHEEYGAGVRCVKPSAGLKVLDAVDIYGRGTQEHSLGVRDDPRQFCWLTYGNSFKGPTEQCRVQYKDNAWSLIAESTLDEFRCGARCALLNNAWIGAIETSWVFITEAASGGISTKITYGSSRANGKSLTSSWQSSVTVGMEVNAIFLKTSISTSFGFSMAEAVSETLSVSYGREIEASCPARAGYHVALFQWYIEGHTKAGSDQIFHSTFRCQYSVLAPVPAPACPYPACGADTNCELRGCTHWTR